MNLNPNYQYVILDTETTGLSIEDDQIIQIALITLDHEWNVTNRFSHYVKPEGFGEDQLKPLIQHITGIDPAHIMSAAPLSTIWWQIQQYFTDTTVVIWHNIAFDLAMLGKHYILTYADTIDTMDCSRALLHYQRSYSLEIIHTQLLRQPRYEAYLKGIAIKAHDALSDCYMTWAVLHYCVDRIGDLVAEYAWLSVVLCDGQRSKYVAGQRSKFRSDEDLWHITSTLWPINLPTLKAPLASPKTMVDHEYYDWTWLPSTSKIWLEHAGFRESLLRLVHPHRKMIIAFAHRAKLDLAKKILADHGIAGIGYMRPNQYIDPSQLMTLSNQQSRDQDEVSRMLKYCSHHLQWLSVLDHNVPWDFKVYARMRLVREDAEADIILSTHAGVYAALQDNTHPDHAILFRDHQWRLSTAQRFYQSGVRIDHMLNMIQWVSYKLRHQDNIDPSSNEYLQILTWLDEFESWREVTRWVFGAEILANHRQFPTNNKWNIEYLWGIPRDIMHQFTALYGRRQEYFTRLASLLTPQENERINHTIARLDTLLQDWCQIELQTSYQWDNVIISPVSTYVDYADFRALFTSNHVIFTQTTWSGNDDISTPLWIHPPTLKLSHIRELNYQDGQKLFIIQSNRNQCRSTFDALMKAGLNHKTLLMGENVTGGGNKLIEQSHGSKSYVMIWWYDLYMQTLAAGVIFDAVIVIWSLGVLHDQMMRDVDFYAS